MGVFLCKKNSKGPKTVEDMQRALKDVFVPLFEDMLNGEMENHLGYSNNDRGAKDTANRRNGYTHKTLKTSVGDVPIDVPRDRDGSFEPQVVPKRKTESKYPGAVRIWKENFRNVEQLFNYGSEVRRVMYATNAIESVNSSFPKVTPKGSFSSETAVFKVFYLRNKELYKKWHGHSIRNWAMVMNQLVIDDRIEAMVSKYQATM